MSDLFAFGRAVDDASDVSYGLAGDMKKTQYVLQLLGSPGQADTLKCLLTAIEMGMETDTGVLDMQAGQQGSEDYLALSPFGMVPTLKEAEYYVAGETGIMSYIEARGLGKRLPPKNATLLAEQNYWSDIACTEVGPHVETLVHERVYKGMEGAAADENAVEAARGALVAPLDALDAQLGNDNTFIIGNYSFADIHWTAYVHLLYETGDGDLVDHRRNIKAWFDRIRTHKSFSGQNIVAYELLPSLDDIRNNRLSSVEIDDF
jgi:glutathione S-transferase